MVVCHESALLEEEATSTLQTDNPSSVTFSVHLFPNPNEKHVKSIICFSTKYHLISLVVPLDDNSRLDLPRSLINDTPKRMSSSLTRLYNTLRVDVANVVGRSDGTPEGFW
jgi:hypothetical protein